MFLFCRKSKEILRLISMKKCTINENAKIIISIDCAANLINSEFQTDEAIKLSGLKKKEYGRQKELIEKLLDLGKKLTLDEICAQLELSDSIKTDAAQLLKEYKKTKFLSEDINDAQYLSMAIYQSCHIRKYKTSNIKSKLIQLSRLSTKTWKGLENEWVRWIEANPSVLKQAKPAKPATSNNQVEEKGNTNKRNYFSEILSKIYLFLGNTLYKHQKIGDENMEPEIQPYEEWRAYMIKRAEAELKKIQGI